MGKRYIVAVTNEQGQEETLSLKQWLKNNPQDLPKGMSINRNSLAQLEEALIKNGWNSKKNKTYVLLTKPSKQQISSSTTKDTSFLIAIEKTFKLFKDYSISITLVCYIAGFIITNVHLGSFGFANFEIFSARYILSGVLFLTFLIGGTYPFYIFRRNYIYAKSLSFKKAFSYFLNSIFSNIFILTLLAAPGGLFYSFRLPNEFFIGSFLINFVLSTILFFNFIIEHIMTVAFKRLSRFLYSAIENTEDVFEEFSQAVLIPVFLIGAFFMIASGYIQLVYPKLPQHLGGGEEILVEVTLKSNSTRDLMHLLDRTPSTLILRDQNCESYELIPIEVPISEIAAMSLADPRQSLCP